jgi:hypothetical protein
MIGLSCDAAEHHDLWIVPLSSQTKLRDQVGPLGEKVFQVAIGPQPDTNHSENKRASKYSAVEHPSRPAAFATQINRSSG